MLKEFFGGNLFIEYYVRIRENFVVLQFKTLL